MTIDFDAPAFLWLLPLALLPLLPRRSTDAVANTWLARQPRDRASVAFEWTLRLAGVVALAGALVGAAGPYRPEAKVERIGRGAEIVLVLDRSRSMDQGFAGARAGAPAGTGPEALSYYATLRAAEMRVSKGEVARGLLSQFAAGRPDDRFALVVFSTLPLRVLGFTSKGEVVQAAIAAAGVGRGLAETDIGRALLAGLAAFDGRPYTGSRIVLLVSDGGDRIDPDTRERIAQRARRHRVAVDWLYIRSPRSPGLAASAADAAADSIPELFLNRYFESLGLPYRAWEADTPDALQKAIADVDRAEKLPIAYLETLPRRELAPYARSAALAAALLLLAAEAARVGGRAR